MEPLNPMFSTEGGRIRHTHTKGAGNALPWDTPCTAASLSDSEGMGCPSLRSRSRIDLSPTCRRVVNSSALVTALTPDPPSVLPAARCCRTPLCKCRINAPVDSNAWAGMDELGEMWVLDVWETLCAALQLLLCELPRLLSAACQLPLLLPISR